MSYSFSLYHLKTFQYVESSLHKFVVVTLGKPRASFQVVKNNLCEESLHKILIYAYM